MEIFKAEIKLQKTRSQKHFERFQTFAAHMIAHFTMNYDNDICNSLNELWESDCLKEQQKSDDIFDTKGIGILITLPVNFVTTLKKENLNKKVNKTMIIKTTEEHKMFEGKIDIKIVKIEVEAEVLGTTKQDTKNDKDEKYPTSAELRNLHSDRKNKHKFGKFNRPSKQQENKTTFDVVVIETIRNEETEERRQSHTVIVPDTQETDGDQQSNGEDANNFLFHGQGATRTN